MCSVHSLNLLLQVFLLQVTWVYVQWITRWNALVVFHMIIFLLVTSYIKVYDHMLFFHKRIYDILWISAKMNKLCLVCGLCYSWYVVYKNNFFLINESNNNAIHIYYLRVFCIHMVSYASKYLLGFIICSSQPHSSWYWCVVRHQQEQKHETVSWNPSSQ